MAAQTSNTEPSTREQILDLARYLFQSRGYQGFSYRDISEPLGVKNAAIHYHFPSKNDLGLALIDRYLQILRESTREFMKNGGPAAPQIEGYLCFSHREVIEHDCLCPISMLATNFESVPGDLRERGQILTRETHAWLTRALELGRDQGELNFKGDPSAKALALMAAVQGAGHLSRTLGHEVFEQTLRQIRMDIDMQQVTPIPAVTHSAAAAKHTDT